MLPKVLAAIVYYVKKEVYGVGTIERGKYLALLHIQIARGLIIGYSVFCLGFEIQCTEPLSQVC